MVPPPPKSTLPSSASWMDTSSSSKMPRSFPRYSAFASFDPLFPLAPVNLQRTIPFPRYATFFLSKLDAYVGSNADDTSEESILEFARHLRIARSPFLLHNARTSATVFSKNKDCIPVAPTEPISSLSTRIQHAVFSGVFTSVKARREGYAQHLSSCP